MNVKLNRESILVILMSLMILIGVFYYGNRYFIEPLKEEASILSDTVRGQEILLNNYPPEESLKEEYEEAYAAKETFLPLGDQANKEFVRLEQLANQANVVIRSVSRLSSDQSIVNVPDHFVKVAYTIQMTSDSSSNFRNLIDQLMDEERVWNIPAFTYDKSGEATYNATFTYELPYFNNEPMPEETSDEMNSDEDTGEEAEN